eukprot:TRINITY_DN42145_c0_g1_i1.p1 TRINITY_DN42145_c0_g1~~TRINITY_DN42145_c0_g1_i1.p1  ORF type:complete len:283 (-),score=43.37 TRINITY_DN42145_c0_g1_i1:212-1060(-)
MGCQCAKAGDVVEPTGGARSAPSKPPSKDVIAKKVAQANSTRVLALRECGLKVLPKEVIGSQGAPFRTVDLSVNLLTSLDEVVVSWSGLQSLMCSQNHLKELPSSIGELQNLQKFVLSVNQLTTLPLGIGNLAKLKLLQLDSNKLGPILPDVFGGPLAGSLEELDLKGNALQELAPTLGTLLELQRLDVSENELADLPEDLANLSKLRHLDASINKVTAIRPTLLQQTAISELWLKGNPLDRLVVQKTPGFDAFLERRKQRLDQKIDSQVVGEVNLAVCGLD